MSKQDSIQSKRYPTIREYNCYDVIPNLVILTSQYSRIHEEYASIEKCNKEYQKYYKNNELNKHDDLIFSFSKNNTEQS